MIVFYILAGMWTAGCTLAPLWATICLWRDEPSLSLVTLFVGLPLGVLIGVFPWGMMQDAESPELASLRKGQWVCTYRHHYPPVGKIPARNECRAYEKVRRS